MKFVIKYKTNHYHPKKEGSVWIDGRERNEAE
jgi:hypothetical protein